MMILLEISAFLLKVGRMVTRQPKPTKLGFKSVELPHEIFSNYFGNRLISIIAPMKGVVVIKKIYYQELRGEVMRKKFPGKRKAIALGVILAGFSVPVAAQDDIEIEEVVVTGSFIRGTPLDAPSPVQIIDRSSIEAQGAAIIWDVIKNLEVNSGSFTNSGSGERSQVEGTAQINLRNLGENSGLSSN